MSRLMILTIILAGLAAGSLVRANMVTAGGGTIEGTFARTSATPVVGPSTLHRLGLSIGTSSMGWEGRRGPSPGAPPSTDRSKQAGRSSAVSVLTGADLYRVSCRSCHKADGSGGLPEIDSVLGPVRSASVQWMTDRLKNMGRTVDPALISELTSSTEADLRSRMKVGGENMPSFGHLSDQEIQVLRPYLDEISGLPGAEHRQQNITEPVGRVGEFIVKGTCHICHDATGLGKKPTASSPDVIPSLANIARHQTVAQFVQKVREGGPIPSSSRDVASSGHMPIFDYLTEAEVASAYAYLIAYPPITTPPASSANDSGPHD